VAKAGNLTSKNLAKTAVCHKPSVYQSGCAKSQLNAARGVALLSSDPPTTYFAYTSNFNRDLVRLFRQPLFHALRNYMKDTPYWDERRDKEGSALVTAGGTAFFNCSSSA
jgi:hypothetical protein